MATYRKLPIVPLETPRLLLRTMTMADAPRIQELFPNPNVLRFMAASIPWPYPDDGAESYLRRTLPRIERMEEYYWAIVRRGHEAEGLVGGIGLMPASDEESRGFWLGEPYWGQGFMREASDAVTAFAFDTLGMTELRLNNAAPNAASHRIKESAGAEIVSVGDTEYVGGTFPGVRWRLTAEAWRRQRPAGETLPGG